MFGKKKINEKKNCLVKKKWVNKTFGLKIFGSEKILCQKFFGVKQKISDQKDLGLKILLSKISILIGVEEVGEIIPFPVWMILFPVFKTSFELDSKSYKHFAKEVFW